MEQLEKGPKKMSATWEQIDGRTIVKITVFGEQAIQNAEKVILSASLGSD